MFLRILLYFKYMFSHTSKVSRFVLSFGVFMFLAVSFLSLSHFGISMVMGNDMSMSHCPFMSEMGVCDMSLFEHIATWQSVFANILTPENIIFTLLLLAVLLLPYWTTFFSPPKGLLVQAKYISNRKRVPIVSFFQVLFSQGILNPKLF